MVCPANSSYSFRATDLIFFYAPATKSGGICVKYSQNDFISFLLVHNGNMICMGNYTHFTTGNNFIFPYQEWKIKCSICIQVEYDRTSYIVLKNFWLVYNFLVRWGHHLCLTDTLHFLKITPNKTTLSIIIKCGGILLF